LRVRADEHVAPAIVRAICDIALGDGFELTSVLREGFKGSSDVHWITAFAQDGGEAILTADTDFLKQPPQVQAVERTGLRVIHLPGAWANSTRAIQAGHLLIWWQRVETTLKGSKARDCYTMPFSVSDCVPLKKVMIDFHRMNRKAKKASRPGRADRKS
jgi:hypothetical protein